MQKVKMNLPALQARISQKLKRGLPLRIIPGHTIRLEVANKPLTVHTELSLYLCYGRCP